MLYCYPKEKRICKLYEKAREKVYGKISGKFISKSDMKVLVNEFYDLMAIIMERILLIEMLKSELSSEKNEKLIHGGSSTLYASDFEEMIREHAVAAMNEWNEMNHIYNREACQCKCRISDNDLEVHHVLLMQLRNHIHDINDEELTGIPSNLGNDNMITNNATTSSIIKTEILNDTRNDNATKLDESKKRLQLLGDPQKITKKHYQNLSCFSSHKNK